MGQSKTSMEILCKLVILVLIITFTRGEDNQDMEEMKEIMRDMNLRVPKAEEKLAITEDKLAEALNDLATTKHDLSVALNEISKIRDPPHMHACGYKDSYTNFAGIIAYSTLLYSSTNTEGGGLDISTGLFTSPHPGSYTVTWGLHAAEGTGKDVKIYLQHNGNNIEESLHQSYHGGSGSISEQGGRTIVLHLDMGDTLALYYSSGSGELF